MSSGKGASPMPEQERPAEQGRIQQTSHVDTSFDELARGLSNGTLSRRRALRMLGAALVGGALASIPGVAWAKGPPGRGRACPGSGGQLPCGGVCCEPDTRICERDRGKPHCACNGGLTECGGPTHRCCFPPDEVCVN